MFSTMLGMGIMAPVMPLFLNDLGATGIWLGLIGGGYHVSRAVLMPFIGRWSDRRGRKLFLGIGLFVYAAVSLLYILADNLAWLLTIRLLHGLVSGMIIPVARAWVGDITPPGEEGRWQGYFNTSFFAGSAAGPILGGLLMDFFNTDIAFAAMGVINLIAFLAVTLFLRENKKPKESQPASASFRQLVANPLFMGLFLQRIGLELCYATFIFFLPVYANEKLGLGAGAIGVLIGVTLLASSLLQIYTGRLADRFDQRKLIIVGGLVAFITVIFIAHSPNIGVFIVVFVLRALGSAVALPSSSAIMVKLGRDLGMGAVISLLGLATSIGMGIGPILAGPVHDYLGGITAVFYYAGGIGLAGLLGFIICYRPGNSTITGTNEKIKAGGN